MCAACMCPIAEWDPLQPLLAALSPVAAGWLLLLQCGGHLGLSAPGSHRDSQAGRLSSWRAGGRALLQHSQPSNLNSTPYGSHQINPPPCRLHNHCFTWHSPNQSMGEGSPDPGDPVFLPFSTPGGGEPTRGSRDRSPVHGAHPVQPGIRSSAGAGQRDSAPRAGLPYNCISCWILAAHGEAPHPPPPRPAPKPVSSALEGRGKRLATRVYKAISFISNSLPNMQWWLVDEGVWEGMEGRTIWAPGMQQAEKGASLFNIGRWEVG